MKTENTKHFNKRKLKHGAMAYAMTAIFIVVLILINFVVGEIFKRFPVTLDMTSTKSFTLSDQTIDYVKGLDADIKIYVMALENEYTAVSEYSNQTNEMLKRYAQYSDSITVEYRDLLTNPDFVAGYTEDIGTYDIILETTLKDENGEDYKRVKVLKMLDLVDFGNFSSAIAQYQAYGYSDNVILYNMSGYVQGSIAEQEITSAIMSITDKDSITVTVSNFAGANEADISAFTSILSKNGYLVNSINIQTDAIPNETDLLIIPAPKLDYGEEEVKKVSDYLNNGGKLEKDLLYIASPEQPDTPNLDELLAEFGIEVTDQRIVETNASYIYNEINFTFQFAVSDTYKQDIQNPSLSLFVPNSLNVKALFETDGMKITESFISSSSKAVLYPSNAPADWTTADAVDRGVFNSMVVGSQAVFYEDNTTGYSNVAVISSSDFFDSSLLTSSQVLNGEFILSFVNGLTQKTSIGITIVPKTLSGAVFEITEAQKSTLKWTFSLIIPLAVLAIGVVVWARRRNR